MKVEIEVSIPAIPNFIQVGTESRDVKHFTDEQLLMIAGEWTDALLKHAEKRRKAPDEVKLRKALDEVKLRKAWDGVLAEDR